VKLAFNLGRESRKKDKLHKTMKLSDDGIRVSAIKEVGFYDFFRGKIQKNFRE